MSQEKLFRIDINSHDTFMEACDALHDATCDDSDIIYDPKKGTLDILFDRQDFGNYTDAITARSRWFFYIQVGFPFARSRLHLTGLKYFKKIADYPNLKNVEFNECNHSNGTYYLGFHYSLSIELSFESEILGHLEDSELIDEKRWFLLARKGSERAKRYKGLASG
ncbi:MAG TPA: hypothetical protein ENI11_04245 [Actinobacteria bacterium]|nr:hypothetical protein [Actinomycetota bacterium]